MSDKASEYGIQVSQFFCEDYRLEEGGKPMFIGMLSPVMFGDQPFKGQSVYTVTYLTMPVAVERVDLELHLTCMQDGEKKTHSYQTYFETDETDVGPNWSAIAPLSFELFLEPDGEPVEALLKCNGQKYHSTLQIVLPKIPSDTGA